MGEEKYLSNEIKSFPERLQTTRTLRGMTQRELAAKLAISERELKYYESGERDPRSGTLYLMGQVLNVSVDELLGWSPKSELLRVSGKGIEAITDPEELIRIMTNSIRDMKDKKR